MKPSTYLPVAFLATTTLAVPLSRRADDAGSSDAGAVTGTVNEVLLDLCKSIDGSMLTSTVCTTATGTDVSVGAATENGLATVVISGAGLLQGASITVPVASAEGILGQLSKRHVEPVIQLVRGVDIDLGGLQLKRGVDVDLGGLQLKREAEQEAKRGVDVDLGGILV